MNSSRAWRRQVAWGLLCLGAAVFGTACGGGAADESCKPGFIYFDGACRKLCNSSRDCDADALCNDNGTCLRVAQCGSGCIPPEFCTLQGCTTGNLRPPGFTFAPAGGLITTEGGGSATFTVVLDAAPLGTVTLPLVSNRPAEGGVSPGSVSFDLTTWARAQAMLVTGVDDAAADGDQAYQIVTGPAVSVDGRYDGLNPSDLEVTNLDDDGPGFQVQLFSPPLVTTEAGGAAVYTVRLNTPPAAPVSLTLASDDPSEGVVSPASLEFSAADWSTPQPVTVTGVDDELADGDQAYTVVHAAATSADSTYAGRRPVDVALVNRDDDSPGFNVMPATLETRENGPAETFSVQLNTVPLANVTVTVASADPSEGSVSPATLVFTPAAGRAAQTVTVTPTDDTAIDGAQVYTVVLGAATSSDAEYHALDPEDVLVTNADDEPACDPPCAGNCARCVGGPGAWSCAADEAACAGNCDVCAGAGTTWNCAADVSLCTGNCDQCAWTGAVWNCAADGNACAGNCVTCSATTPTRWDCAANPAACVGDCDECVLAGTSASCAIDAELCSGNCVTCSPVSATNWSCAANAAACTGTCDQCVKEGTNATCAADVTQCHGDCAACYKVSDTNWSCDGDWGLCDSDSCAYACLTFDGLFFYCGSDCGSFGDCCCFQPSGPCGCYCDYGNCPANCY